MDAPKAARDRPRRFATAGATVLAALLAWSSCVAPGAAQTFQQPDIKISPDRKTATMALDVLTYNIEGVPWRAGRKAQLKEIGRRLNLLRESGRAPDIVLFQEVFSDDAKEAVHKAFYPAAAVGPDRSQRRTLPGEGERRGHKWTKGELGVRFVGSGLVIASVYPISVQEGEPFSRRACAGFDCLSNKGGLFARIRVPGLPESLDIFDTHMNAQGASRVKPRRYTPAHEAQSLELAQFVDQQRNVSNPTILGGDFNMRGSEARFDFFEGRQTLEMVHRYCVEHRSDCDVRVSWDGDAPWMDTQDLQFFGSGARVKVRPVRVEALFDGRADSPKLSDHDGFNVTYELSWAVAEGGR